MEKKLCVVIAPTNNCNLRCDYCYNNYNYCQGDIEWKTVEDIIQKAFRDYDFVSFVWRGGEPLLLKNNFYRKVFFCQLNHSKKTGTSFRNCIQTNGTLLTKSRIRFFKRYHYDLGISFDGLDNDLHRSDSQSTLNAIKNCSKINYSAGIITVITADSTGLINQYEYLKNITDNIKFTPCFDAAGSNLSVTSKWYINELKKLLDHWIADKKKVFVTPITDYIRYIFGVYLNRECIYASCLGKTVDIDSKGVVRICAHIPDSDFVIGDISDFDSIGDIFNAEQYKAVLLKMIEKRNKCKATCSIFDLCQGGCCSEKQTMSGSDTTFSCSVLKEILPYYESRVKSLITKKDTLDDLNPAFVEIIQEAFCHNPLRLKQISDADSK